MGRDENDLEDGELEDGEWEDTQQKYSQEGDAYLRGLYCVSSTTSCSCQVDAEKITREDCIGRGERDRAVDDRDYSKLFEKSRKRRDESKFIGKNTESSGACDSSERGPNVDRNCSRILKKKGRYDVRMKRSYAEAIRNKMRSAHESRTFAEKNRPADTKERRSSEKSFSHLAKMEKHLCDGKVTLCARRPCGNQRSSSRSEVVEKNDKLYSNGDRKGNEEYSDVTRSRISNGRMGERRPVEALLASINTSIQLKSDNTSEIFESGDSTDAYCRRKAQHVQVESPSRITENNEQTRIEVARSFTQALTNHLQSSRSSEISEKENKRDVYLLEATRRTTNETDCSRIVEMKQMGRIDRNISRENTQGKDNQVKQNTCSSSGIKASAEVVDLTKIENGASMDQNADDGWIFESLGETPKANQVERSGREAVDIDKLMEELEKERMKLVHDRKQMEESLARDKKQLAANLYTLLVTARHQIGQLNADKESLTNKLEANSVLKCPSCSHVFSISKNCVKPKYTRVLRGRDTIEIRFENFDELRRWLSLNNMERDADGLPVLPEPQATQPTLHSTNSLILAASKAENTQPRKDIGRSRHVSNGAQESGLENAGIVHKPCNFNEHRSSLKIEARRSHSHTRISKQCDQRTDNTSTHRECDLMKRETERTSDRARPCNARQKSLERLRKRSRSPLKCASSDGSYWSGRHSSFERTNIKSRRTHYEERTTHCHFSTER